MRLPRVASPDSAGAGGGTSSFRERLGIRRGREVGEDVAGVGGVGDGDRVADGIRLVVVDADHVSGRAQYRVQVGAGRAGWIGSSANAAPLSPLSVPMNTTLILLMRKIAALSVVAYHVPIPDDHALAADLAERAGQLLLALRARSGDPDTLRNAGDRQSHEFLMAELAKYRPADAVLSEEGLDDKARLTADRVWIVDPLDGTREFGDPGRTDWAVHVALWARNARNAEGGEGDLIAGAVALPAQNRVLATHSPSTGDPHATGNRATGDPMTTSDPHATAEPYPDERGSGAERPDRWVGSIGRSEGLSEGTHPGPGAQRPLRMVVSRSRASDLVKAVGARMNAEMVPCGSAGAKVATVIMGENDVYLHSGGFYEWDTAAPVAVARQRGLHVSRIDGSHVVYNREDPLLPDILVCRPAIAPALLDAIREATYAI